MTAAPSPAPADRPGPDHARLGQEHAPGLARLAAALTAEAGAAARLVASVLASAVPGPGTSSDLTSDQQGRRLREQLVRRYLRTTPRRTESLVALAGAGSSAEHDAGDVLRSLRPRGRAAAALLLLEGWEVADVASVSGWRPSAVRAFLPDTLGLESALTAVAEQHAPTLGEVDEALAAHLARRPASAARPGLRRSLTAVGTALVLLGGYAAYDALDPSRDDEAGVEVEGLTVDEVVGSDLSEAGWVLDAKGKPPMTATGLQRRTSITLRAGDDPVEVELPTVDPHSPSPTTFAALWCDMPPAQDPSIQVPRGIVRLADGEEIELPCAGRDGAPPVPAPVALPAGTTAQLRLVGDLPPGGGGVLGVYTEADYWATPVLRSARQGPPDPGEAHVIDTMASEQTSWSASGRRTSELLALTAQSTVNVWAGRTGMVIVLVDGVPITDDGDVAAARTQMQAWAHHDPESSQSPPIPSDEDGWRTQRAGVRDGSWVVHHPGQQLTFDLPDELRPGPGEVRTAVIEVITEQVGEAVQVAVTDAVPARIDAAPVTATEPGAVPELILGHRLVGRWELPGDGQRRALELPGGRDLPAGPLVVLAHDAAGAPTAFPSYGEGAATRGGAALPLWLHPDLDHALAALRWSADSQLAAVGDGADATLEVALPPVPRQRPGILLVYAPVPWEEFDTAAAALPPDVYPPGSDAAALEAYAAHEVLATFTEDDLVDGTLRTTVDAPQGLILRVTTEGRTRFRFVVDHQPYGPAQGDGWWSAWTDQPVTSLVEVAWEGPYRRNVQIDAEGDAEFTIELLGM